MKIQELAFGDTFKVEVDGEFVFFDFFVERRDRVSILQDGTYKDAFEIKTSRGGRIIFPINTEVTKV